VSAQTPDPADPFFDDAVVQDIRLAINPRDWESLKEHFQENTYYPCDFRWGTQVVRGIGIRSRGTGSRSGAKPGLRIDFDKYSADQKFLGLKSVLLRNNTQDASNMREVLSMSFFRRMGFRASRESFARLFVNEVYTGLFTIVESIDKAFLQKNLNENDGYLYEYDFDELGSTPFVFQYLGNDPAKYVPQPFKPETHESDPRPEVLERFLWTVNEAGDAAWRQMMTEFLDLKQFMRHLGVENFLAEEDGITGDYGPNNFYFYRYVGKNLFTFLPWDKSNTFWETPDYGIFRNIREGAEISRNRLVLRALKYDDLLNTYLDTLLEAATSAEETASPATGWLEQAASHYYDLIRSAALADPSKPFSNEAFEQAVVDVKTFAKKRSESVRQLVAAQRPR
jgi:spore coat protein CotH